MIDVSIISKRRLVWEASLYDTDAGVIIRVYGMSRSGALAEMVRQMAPVEIGGEWVGLTQESLREALFALSRALLQA